MAREIIVTVWCDGCMTQDTRTPGIELPALTLMPSRKPRILALCDPCKKALYTPLLDLLAARGQAPSDDGEATARAITKMKAANEVLECPVKGCGHTAIGVSAMCSHAKDHHDTTWAELTGAETPFGCPDCDRAFTAPQGLAAHRRTVHGIPGIGKR